MGELNCSVDLQNKVGKTRKALISQWTCRLTFPPQSWAFRSRLHLRRLQRPKGYLKTLVGMFKSIIILEISVLRIQPKIKYRYFQFKVCKYYIPRNLKFVESAACRPQICGHLLMLSRIRTNLFQICRSCHQKSL